MGCGCGGSGPQVAIQYHSQNVDPGVIQYQPPPRSDVGGATNTSDPRYFSINPGGASKVQRPARQKP